jgi:hypothetical protein
MPGSDTLIDLTVWPPIAGPVDHLRCLLAAGRSKHKPPFGGLSLRSFGYDPAVYR